MITCGRTCWAGVSRGILRALYPSHACRHCNANALAIVRTPLRFLSIVRTGAVSTVSSGVARQWTSVVSEQWRYSAAVPSTDLREVVNDTAGARRAGLVASAARTRLILIGPSTR